MTEREESNFKVTDRRKYNPDGSPREGSEPQAEDKHEPETAAAPVIEQPPDNVLSFPGEGEKGQSQPPPAAQQVSANESRAAAQASAAQASPAQTAQASVGQVEHAYNQARGPQSSRLPEASFVSLANMLAVEAAMHLGLIQAPGEEPPPVDLEAARHLIDMLGMLQTKTSGNLTPEEANLLEDILADLRMQFVAISKRR